MTTVNSQPLIIDPPDPQEYPTYRRRQLETEIQYLLERTENKKAYHWSSYPEHRQRFHPHAVIRIAYLRCSQWIGLWFSRYHEPALKIIQQIPPRYRYFYKKQRSMRYAPSVWCIHPYYFQEVIPQLQALEQLDEELDLEFIIQRDTPDVPPIFESLNLTFYERGIKSDRSK